jgi:hypothetical protein
LNTKNYAHQGDQLKMNEIAPIREAEVKTLAIDWYEKLTKKVPLNQYIPLLAKQNLKMEFPNGNLIVEWNSFQNWYEQVTNTFFDQIHILKHLEVKTIGDRAEVQIVVHWEASMWQPPAAKSQRIVLDAFQNWVVRRSLTTQLPVIQTYIVERFEYAAGSARL